MVFRTGGRRGISGGLAAGAPRALARRPGQCERPARLRPLHARGRDADLPPPPPLSWGEGQPHPPPRHSITLLTLESARVKEITAFLNPEAFDHFDLPEM